MKNVSFFSFDFISKSISNCDPSSECEENRLELKKTKYSNENRDVWFTLIPSISYSRSNERKNSLQKTSQTSIANILIHSNICTFLFPSKSSLLSFKEFSRSTKKLRPLNWIFGHYWLFYSLIFVTILTRSIETVRINSISRPQSFRYGTLNEVILDCDFTIDDQDELLIVKWFLNDDAQHIYQWIQSPDVRTYSDRIKPYVDEKFVVKDYQTRHRALRLINPPISLSGKYTCSVSSLQNEDNNSTHLVIYEPARSFEMAAIEDDDDENNGFNISCNAYGFYPEPEMKLFKVRSINDTLESEEVKSNTTVTSLRLSTDEFYSITLLSHIEPDLSQTKRSKSHRTYFENEEDIGGEEFMKPSRQRLLSDEQKQRFGKNSERNRQNIAEHYECRVNIPNTDYVEIKRLAIQNGWRTKWNTNKGHPQSSSPRILVCLVLIFLVKISLLQQSLRSFYCC